MSSKKIGLALSSGGWRGLAHIGVIKTLLANDIPIDVIAGTSTGALIGGLYAATQDIGRVEDFFTNLSYRKLLYAFADPQPISGLFKGQRAVKIIEAITQGKKIEDLDLAFAAICADVKLGKQVTLTEGNLAEAIRASASVPLVFRPVNIKDHQLVDGAIINPLPVRQARALGADIVIAVNLYRNVFPWHPNRLKPLQVALKTTQLMLKELARRNGREADILIQPKIKEGNRYNIFTKVIKNPQTIEAGQTAAKNKLIQIKKTLI